MTHDNVLVIITDEILITTHYIHHIKYNVTDKTRHENFRFLHFFIL